MKRFRVFQFARFRHLSGPDTVRMTGCGDYRWKWTARLSMWVHSGSSKPGYPVYTCERADIEYLDPEPWVNDFGIRFPANDPNVLYGGLVLDPRPQYYQTPEYYQKVDA